MAVSMKLGMSRAAVPAPATSTGPFKAGLRSAFISGPSPKRNGVLFTANKRVVTQATSGEDVDFDKVLSDIADKFEKSENKAAIIGYGFAAVGALWFSEWLIHLPGLNFLLGFPIQLLGLVLLPYFGVKYLVDKDNVTSDAGSAFDRVVKKLPGVGK